MHLHHISTVFSDEILLTFDAHHFALDLLAGFKSVFIRHGKYLRLRLACVEVVCRRRDILQTQAQQEPTRQDTDDFGSKYHGSLLG
jgi:hypothetical protein